MPAFACHIGIDYSGDQTAPASLLGLRVHLAEWPVERLAAPAEARRCPIESSLPEVVSPDENRERDRAE